ncbi:hypothetical protein NDU88_008004 [Pleurodeles waltl]|uniref:Uncharacterized protein n=1 Tax=Pleurodeles waltl TaxID=8319 RepID=A0AAV7PN21_PLEWA|nr:hypothetical protein NDU88_008004 [Pleurodeles waltl]
MGRDKPTSFQVKSDKYTAQSGDGGLPQNPTEAFNIGAILQATQGLRWVLETKIGKVAVDVTLLSQDLHIVVDKVFCPEGFIFSEEEAVQKLEDQDQAEDVEKRARRNNHNSCALW